MIRVYESEFTEEDAQYAYNAVKSGILSSFGKYTSELENKLTDLIGRKYGLTCSNGTSALHLALVGLDIIDSRVLIPVCSFAATAFAAIAANNRISFVDCDKDTWNIDPDKIEEACIHFDNMGDPIRAVIAVHTYGNPYDYEKLNKLSKKWNFSLIEDGCEALLASNNGINAGAMGVVSVFSFYGNKLIASGEGGFVLTDDKDVHERMKLFRGQGQDPNRRFWHIMPGFNYRMTNLQASVVVSQLNRVTEIQKRKIEIMNIYKERLSDKFEFQKELPNCTHSWWMVSIVGKNHFYEKASKILETNGIETRPVFPPLFLMPAFSKHNDASKTLIEQWIQEGHEYSNALNLYINGITLPSGPKSTDQDIHRVCDILVNI